MLKVTISLEREDELFRIFADLTGFYLGGTDLEKILGSVIPLAQHCYWRNHKICVVPERDLDHKQLLETNELTISFAPTGRMRGPNIMIDGEWWRSPHGTEFFIPIENEVVDTVILDKILEDIANE